jgi:cyclopropane fatty-acyl-phospholipid synthase-like methyltransferase
MGADFDFIIDSGLFDAMADEEKPVFAQQVRRVLKPGGKYFMLCFSEKEHKVYGLRRISIAEIELTFKSLLTLCI